VTGYRHLIDSIELAGRDDQHVLGTAIHCRANVIASANRGDFLAQALANFNIEAEYPDDFVLALFEAFPELVEDAARNPPSSLRILQGHRRNTCPSWTHKA